MRPFRFFFVLALGFMLFFFVARFLIVALIAAAVMSTVFFIARRIKGFFQRMDWDEGYHAHHPYQRRYQRSLQQAVWKDDLLVEYPNSNHEYLPNYQSIEVR
ncbi:MAG: hypothetical protein KTR30_15670 [Saprospiraceae bacterium]|nr:hypothetical protein [Saprospiraceae bacterium]